jgi:type II secretory pathway pseudopilin PulG
MQKEQKSIAAYSLVEVIVAMGVVTLFSVSVFGTIVTSAAIHESSRELEIANQILQHEVENVRGLRWENIEDLAVTDRLAQRGKCFSKKTSVAITLWKETSTTRFQTYGKSPLPSAGPARRGKPKQLSSSSIYYTKEGLSDSYYRNYD